MDMDGKGIARTWTGWGNIWADVKRVKNVVAT